ncbi:hypothetical protein AX16_001736 [Volvariella volvacea WC 439]|nr:hypothetical protein AX16_001736 [Volvariella volvacea WC 439]
MAPTNGHPSRILCSTKVPQPTVPIVAVETEGPAPAASFGVPTSLLQPNPLDSAPANSEQDMPAPSSGVEEELFAEVEWGIGDDELAANFLVEDFEVLNKTAFEEMTEGEALVREEVQWDNDHSPEVVSGKPQLYPSVVATTVARNEWTNSINPKVNGSSAFSVLMSPFKESQAWEEATAAEDPSFRPTKNSRRKTPFYKVLQGMPIAVDAFRYGTIPGVTAYFLTHAHSDHYTNLSSSWKSGPIYCSEGTANFILHMLNVDKKWVHPLLMDTPTLIPDTNGVFVTPIEANHCPGSCIFLFEGPQSVNAGDSTFKSPFISSSRTFRYLHCGDFRASPQHVLHPAIKGKKIDHVYLDTTYLDPKYTFPPQPLVISACAELAQRIANGRPTSGKPSLMDGWISSLRPAILEKVFSKPNCVLFVIGTYSIGKERIVKAVAQALKSKIFCEQRKTGILRCQADSELHSMLTSNPLDAHVHLVPLALITSDRLKTYLQRFKGTFSRVVGFRPTGWTFTPGGNSELMTTIDSVLSRNRLKGFTYSDLQQSRNSSALVQLYGVPYSEHSSFYELTCFALSLDWNRMIATVNVGSESSRAKISKWVSLWEEERKRRGSDGIVPYRQPGYW